MSWKQQRKKHPKGFTVIVDEDSAVMPPKNRNFANPMITFRTHSNPDPSITINMPRKWKFHGNVPQRTRDVSISFDKRIEFGQAGPSTEKIVIENDAQVAEQKPRNRLFEALGVKKPIVVNTDLIGPAFVSKISFSNPFLVAKQGDEPKKKQAKEVLTEARIKRSAINPILPPGVDKPVAQKRAEPVVIPTVRTPAAEPTLTVIRPPAKLAKESSQQPSATVDTTTSPDTTKTEEMLRIFPKKQTYDPEKMTTSDKEKMQKEIFATRKRKFEQNSQMNPTVLPPHLLQPIKRKTIETPSARGKSEEKSYRRIEASLKGPRKEEEEKQTINVLKIKPKVSPLEKLPNDHRTSSVREHKADEHDFDQRKQDEGWNKTVQKMKSLRKSVEKERNSLHHNFEHSRDLRKSEVYISHARQIDHRRRMDSRNRTTVSSQRLPENGPILSGNKVVCEVGSKKEDTYSSHHRSHQSKQAGDSKRAPSPLVTLTVKETTVIRPETEHDTNRRDHRSSHHRRHDNNKKESQSEKVYSATATSLENDSISMRQVTEDDIKRKGRPSSSQRKASSSKSQDERKQNPSPETTGKENGSISIRQVTENDSSHIDKHSSHPRRHENSKEKDASECRESVVLRTKERESTWIEPKKERDRESRKRHRNTSLQRDRDHCKKMREDDRKVPSNRLGKKPWSERDQSRKHEKRGGRDSKEDWSKKEYKSEFETPKVLDSTNDRDRIIPFFTNKYVFSNHFPCPGLKINEKNFCCIEQYYMWRKAKFSKNEAAAAAILMSTDAKQMKLIGSSLDKFDARSWKKVSWKYMLEANLQKYEQFEKLRFELFRTIGGVLVEASPKDNWWGVGLDLDSEDLKDWRKWKGKNLLGELLMEIRDRLSREYKYKEEVRRARRCLLVNAQ